jgi:hypothetical protein
VTVLADYSQLSRSSQYNAAVSNTFGINAGGGFLNNYYDDEGWWALAWIAASDRTGNAHYLNMSGQIFSFHRVSLCTKADTRRAVCKKCTTQLPDFRPSFNVYGELVRTNPSKSLKNKIDERLHGR